MVTVNEIRAQAAIEREAIGNVEVHQHSGLTRKKPKPMAQEAYYGILGEIVDTIGPHTESAPEALLIDALAQTGNQIGRGPYSYASGARHGTNEFFVLVGPTGSGGRKGSSHGHTRNLMQGVDPEWAKLRIQGGLSSGEGIVHHVRDAVERDGKVTDEGVQDKRLLCYEPELAQVLMVMQRHGSTLSTQLRQSWDSGDLNIMTKNSATRAGNAHISMLAHITPEELKQLLPDVQAANGWGNRYLWAWVQRSKLLPEGGGLPSFGPLVPRLHHVLEKAGKCHLYKRSPDAVAVWAEVYHLLAPDRPGVSGALCARGDAHALRLQTLYAALDGTYEIRPEHVFAALEVVRYGHDSVLYVFGDKTGDKTADRILDSIRTEGPKTRSEIHLIFNGNMRAQQLQTALDLLLEHEYAQCEYRDPNEGGMKPVEVWTATNQ